MPHLEGTRGLAERSALHGSSSCWGRIANLTFVAFCRLWFPVRGNFAPHVYTLVHPTAHSGHHLPTNAVNVKRLVSWNYDGNADEPTIRCYRLADLSRGRHPRMGSSPVARLAKFRTVLAVHQVHGFCPFLTSHPFV